MALNPLQSLSSARRLPLQQLRVARPFHTRPPVVQQTSLVGPPRCTFRAAQSPISTAQRSFTTTQTAYHGTLQRPKEGTGIKVTFRDSKGSDIRTVEANEGDDLLSIAHEYDIDLEGACEGSIACSTCHVILQPEVYDQLEEPGDDENDMLDLAFGLTDTSRLGCQIKLTKGLDGMVAQLPSATRNMSFKNE
ncbi:unnamed protein product [Jaminaea pallidilutea]